MESVPNMPAFQEVQHCDIVSVVKDKLQARQKAALADSSLEDVSERPFCVADLSVPRKQLNLWKEHLPRVKPFYAVKCNDDVQLLKVLAGMGLGFDCASKAEIERVMSLGVSADRIIYANPCKQVSFVRHAARHNVRLMTFDNIPELYKIAQVFPTAQLVLRVLPPATDKVQCELGNKFGCSPDHTRQLLVKARELGLDVVGVSFHVGSGCYDLDIFPVTVKLCARVFDEARELGYKPWLLDVGGGFPGSDTDRVSFPQIAASLRSALDENFPVSSGVQLIAEPGRFFAARLFTLAACVIAVREPHPDKGTERMYYLNDGVYGSFNCLLYDHAHVTAQVLSGGEGEEESCSVWGPTCDGLDVISEKTMLPKLDVGDWMYFTDMGAYTLSAGSTFNGMPRPDVYHVWMSSAVDPPPKLWLTSVPGLREPNSPKKSSESRVEPVTLPDGPVKFVGSGLVVGEVRVQPRPASTSTILHELFPMMNISSPMICIPEPAV